MISLNILKFNIISFKKKWEIRNLNYFIENMWVDVLTKALPKPKHDICCDTIGVRHSIE
jgi:hypothetical protein